MNPPTDLIDDLRLLEPPGPWWTQWWAIAAGAALLLVALWLLWRRIRPRLGRSHAAVAAKEAAVAHEDALGELQKLFAMVEGEQSRPYAIESSGIVRRYIERRFDIRAPRRSTEEFLLEARSSPKLAPEYQEMLGRFLRECDFIKFAKGRATRSELEMLHRAAVQFVMDTRVGARSEAEVAG